MKAKILGIDDLVAQYRDEGEHDSTGSFTLDRKKAQERLALFGLADPYFWILKIVQSLEFSGASSIDIQAGVHKVEIVSDVVPTGFTCIDDVLAHLLTDADQAAPALRHLAAGLQGSLAVSPSYICTKLTHQGVEQSFVLGSGGWKTEAPKQVASQASRFEMLVTRNLSERLNASWFTLNTDIFDLFFRSQESYDKESQAVFRHCRFSRSDVRLKGKAVTHQGFGQARFRGYEIWSDPNPGKRRPSIWATMLDRDSIVDGLAHPSHHLVEWVETRKEGRGFYLAQPCHATVSNRHQPGYVHPSKEEGFSRAYAIRMSLSNTNNLLLVEDGVIIERRTENFDCPGFVALVDASTLAKDLSTMKVRDEENPEFQALLVEVRLAADNLKSLLLENLDKMPGRERIQRSF